MAMPKKGRRQIIVSGNMYFYVIKPSIFGNDSDCGGRLTVEMCDGSYKSKECDGAITPVIVEAFIKENIT